MSKRAQYALVQGPEPDARVHVVDPITFAREWPQHCDAECGRRIGERWSFLRVYRSRAVARKRATCQRCRKILRLSRAMETVKEEKMVA